MAAALVLFAACGGGDSPGGSNDLPQYVVDELKNASEFERGILKDGTVTPGEYEQAVFATLQCAEEEGIGHTEPVLVDRGLLAPRYNFIVGPWPPEEDEKWTRLYTGCVHEFLYGVLAAWSQ